jgi:hypothetical protein
LRKNNLNGGKEDSKQQQPSERKVSFEFACLAEIFQPFHGTGQGIHNPQDKHDVNGCHDKGQNGMRVKQVFFHSFRPRLNSLHGNGDHVVANGRNRLVLELDNCLESKHQTDAIKKDTLWS